MRILVVYYSRTGTTARIAKELCAQLKCDSEEIRDKKDRRGYLGWFIAGRDGWGKKTTVIGKIKHDPSNYDLVIVGTPIWVNTTPAIRTFLMENAGKFKEVAFFCTMGGTGGKKAFLEMEELAGKKPVAVMELREGDVRGGSYKDQLGEFVSKIRV